MSAAAREVSRVYIYLAVAGVIITHGNFVAAAHGLLHGSSYTENSCVLSYLPLGTDSFPAAERLQ